MPPHSSLTLAMARRYKQESRASDGDELLASVCSPGTNGFGEKVARCLPGVWFGSALDALG